jgi:hypothetical protein
VLGKSWQLTSNNRLADMHMANSDNVPRNEVPFWVSGSRRVDCLANILTHHGHSKSSTAINHAACPRRIPGAMPHVDKQYCASAELIIYFNNWIRGYYQIVPIVDVAIELAHLHQ